jgi:hypothetical protein
MVYYNENDKFAARWLGELMRAGAIPKGEIDECGTPARIW